MSIHTQRKAPRCHPAKILGSKPCIATPSRVSAPEPLQSVALQTGETVPFDRAYAIENGVGRFDDEAPRHLPKINFLMLMRDERLATLKTQFDDATETLTILRDGKQVARGQLTTRLGRQLIEQFVGSYMKSELRGAPRIVHAPGHSFSDVSAKCLHIVNLATVRDIERIAGPADRSSALPCQCLYRRGRTVG